MNNEQKQYIEQKIDLIENDKWKEFFEGAPKGIGSVLYESGIDWMQELQYIPEYAFYGSNIQTIDIPDSVRSIEWKAFQGCTSLTSVTIGSGISRIGDAAFRGCTSLTSINIPDSVTRIEDEAFRGCTIITNVNIPNSVQYVGRAAFLNCGYINISYNGTIAEWKTLIDNNSRVFKYTTYTCNCTDGTIKKSR